MQKRSNPGAVRGSGWVLRSSGAARRSRGGALSKPRRGRAGSVPLRHRASPEVHRNPTPHLGKFLVTAPRRMTRGPPHGTQQRRNPPQALLCARNLHAPPFNGSEVARHHRPVLETSNAPGATAAARRQRGVGASRRPALLLGKCLRPEISRER